MVNAIERLDRLPSFLYWELKIGQDTVGWTPEIGGAFLAVIDGFDDEEILTVAELFQTLDDRLVFHATEVQPVPFDGENPDLLGCGRAILEKLRDAAECFCSGGPERTPTATTVL